MLKKDQLSCRASGEAPPRSHFAYLPSLETCTIKKYGQHKEKYRKEVVL